MSFDIKKLDISGKIVLASAAVGLLGLLLPWVELKGLGSTSGIGNFWCIVFTVICWGIPLYTIFTGKASNSAAIIGGGVVGFIFTLIFYSKNTITVFDKSANLSGSGLYIYLCSTIALMIAGILSTKTKDPAEMIQKTIADAKEIKNIFTK